MLQDPNVERYVESATKSLKKEIDKLRTELEELKQEFALYNVSQQSELVCRSYYPNNKSTGLECLNCGKAKYDH